MIVYILVADRKFVWLLSTESWKSTLFCFSEDICHFGVFHIDTQVLNLLGICIVLIGDFYLLHFKSLLRQCFSIVFFRKKNSKIQLSIIFSIRSLIYWMNFPKETYFAPWVVVSFCLNAGTKSNISDGLISERNLTIGLLSAVSYSFTTMFSTISLKMAQTLQWPNKETPVLFAD